MWESYYLIVRSDTLFVVSFDVAVASVRSTLRSHIIPFRNLFGMGDYLGP